MGSKVVHYETIIIGAGASGLMAASRQRGGNIAILEGNSSVGQKIRISGGGRCNITNSELSADNYLGERQFVSSVLRGFDQHALLKWLRVRGLEPVIRKGSQYFCPHSAEELVRLLTKACAGVPIVTGCSVTAVEKGSDALFAVHTSKGVFQAKSVVVATGGMSYPKIGASGIAYEIARHFGHTVTPLRPALVGFTLQREQFWMKDLSGISLEVAVRVAGKEIVGDMLFAHRGISGPAILNSSLYWQKGLIEIDFLPHAKVDRMLSGKKLVSTQLGLPKRFAKAFLEAVGVADKPASQLCDAERAKLQTVHAYRFAPAGNFGYGKAEVTAGGIDTAEIDSETMMSKKCPGLYFLGEALDVTGELGGYNFQWAFATAQRLGL